MAQQARDRKTLDALMRRALEMCDELELLLVSAHLSAAIDALNREDDDYDDGDDSGSNGHANS